MGHEMLLLYFVLFGCGVNYVRAETTSSSKPPFREGIEYRYEWEASIESESSVSDQMATSTWLRGQLYIISKVEGSKWRSLLRIKNVSLAIQHGDKNEKSLTYVEQAELDEHLSKPFHLLYSGSKVEAAGFSDDNEPLWSSNFKRSVSSLLQVELRSVGEQKDNQLYSESELSLYGKCDVRYYVYPLKENQYSVQKDRNLESCPESLGRWRTFIDSSSLDDKQQTIAGLTSTTRYLVSSNRGHPELLKAESLSSVWLDPFGVSKSSIKSITNFTMLLEKTRRSTEQITTKIAFQDQLKFVYQSDIIVDLKAAQNLMLHTEPLINGQENLRRKTQLDLLNAVELLNSETTSSEQRINMDQLPLSVISYQLGSLDYVNARALFKELSVSQKNEKLHSARNLYLDLILHSGSNVGVILLRDLIQEKQIDHFTAARLVAYAGAYVKVPSEKLLIEFQKILDMALADAADNLNVLKNAAILATARLISRACPYGSTDCQSIRIEEWQQKYFDSVKSPTAPFAERALYVHALYNIGYGSVLDSVLEMVKSKTALDDESSNDLKVYIINGLKPYKQQPKVSNVLIRVLRDMEESFRVRIAAAQVILDDHVSTEVFEQVRNMLPMENNSQVRGYLVSAIRTMAVSYNPFNQHLKEKAQQLLNSQTGGKDTVSSGSAEYAFDYFDKSSSFGSQLNLRTTSSEFDDLPGFVAGKVTYFVKEVAAQPFSFTVRMSGMRKYMTNLFSSSLKQEDLVMSRIHATMDDFNFAPRKELGMSLDVAFKLHGTTLMFYHFDKNFFTTALGSVKNMEFLQDLSFNIQRYATTGALLYTQSNGLGLPVSFVFSAPILISLKGSITKTKQPGTVGRQINLNLYGEIYGDHGILSHFTPLNLTQGVVRNRKAIFNVPLNLEIIAEPSKMQLEITSSNPKATNPLEISTFGRTVLTLRPSETSYVKVQRICQQCQSVVVVARKGSLFNTETIANISLALTGSEMYAQVFNCDGGRSTGKQIQGVLEALNPFTMNNRESLAAWAYLSFIRLQHNLFIQPESRHCGFRGRIFRSKHLPVKEANWRVKLKSNISDDTEVAWQTGKIAAKVEINWKGESSVSDRKGEIDFTYEYRNAGARNNMNVRVVVFRSPQLNIMRDFMICLKAESTFQPSPVDIIDISGYSHPPAAQGSIEYVMGDVTSTSQCPTDKFRFKAGIKASAGDWVMEKRNQAHISPYKDCETEKKSQNWAPGIIPQTESCYRTALDFTTLTNYQFDFRFAAVPVYLERIMEKLGDMTSLFLLPYWNAEPSSKIGQVGQRQEVGHHQINITFLPEQTDEEETIINLDWASNSLVERYNYVTLPIKNIPLPSTSIPQATRIAYEGNVIPSCLVTSKYIRTLDKVQFDNTFSPCYTLVTSDCGSNPLFGVFVRRTTGLYPLAAKVQVGGHTIEIIPDESGRRKQFTVRANDLDIDVQSKAYSLPEGRSRFFVLKVRYQAPLYVISSPGAGLLVHYSGSHIAVFPTWFHKNQHCGLCGNFDGETDREWINPQGCAVKNATELIASYTLGQTCYPNLERLSCHDGSSSIS